jgi:hypothetical protein
VSPNGRDGSTNDGHVEQILDRHPRPHGNAGLPRLGPGVVLSPRIRM